jgi:hypothetical protein
MFNPSLVVGLTIMALGVTFLLDSLGISDASNLFKYWPILVVMFGASMIADSMRPADPAGPRRKGTPCFFLFFVIMAMFAFSSFPGARAAARDAARAVNVTGVMHATNRTGGSDFSHGRVAAVMGRSSLDLRQVKLAPGEQVSVDVFVAMGRATVRIPDGWVVDAGALPVMGSVEEHRFSPLDSPAEAEPGEGVTGPPATPASPPRLRLHGFVMMGKVEITS